MKPRIGIVVLAVGGLALALLAPGAVSAAPKAEKPSGQALVRIDGGTAYAKKKDKREYRIVVPDGAEITWLGEVSGKGTRTGTFTPKALVAGWNRLGFRDGARALTTLTWAEAGSPRGTGSAATLSSPRVNADGQLTFLAKVTGGPLPKEMVDFSINIARAETRMGTQSRSTWTTVFRAFPVDSTFSVQATVSNDQTVSIAWPASSGPANPCIDPLVVSTMNYTMFSGFPCGDGTVMDNPDDADDDGDDNHVEMYYASSNKRGQGQVYLYFNFQPTNSSEFNFDYMIAQWDTSGNNKLPAS